MPSPTAMVIEVFRVVTMWRNLGDRTIHIEVEQIYTAVGTAKSRLTYWRRHPRRKITVKNKEGNYVFVGGRYDTGEVHWRPPQ